MAGLLLGMIAIVLALYFNAQENADVKATVNQVTAETCSRQQASAAQWAATLKVIAKLGEDLQPGYTSTPAWAEYVKETQDLLKTPACRLVG